MFGGIAAKFPCDEEQQRKTAFLVFRDGRGNRGYRRRRARAWGAAAALRVGRRPGPHPVFPRPPVFPERQAPKAPQTPRATLSSAAVAYCLSVCADFYAGPRG